jgi:hypothetical protein
MAHPAFSRTKLVRGLDQVDTPPAALTPILYREPLLQGVKTVSEPFAGAGSLVTAMRKLGINVIASDIAPRGCPDCEEIDFFDLRRAPTPVLISNPPYSVTETAIEHAWKIGYKTIIFLVRTTFLHSSKRYETLHKSGRLARVFVLAERVMMHDVAHLARGGKTASQSQTHIWITLDRDHYGASENVPVSMANPTERMPWDVRLPRRTAPPDALAAE